MALDRDAYFTPLGDCDKIIKTALNDHPELRGLRWVEPSAGSGNFVKAAKLNGIDNVEAYDIHPLGDNIIKRDFLNEDTDLTGTFVFGNPPYGNINRLALDFIDRSFEQGAEYVGFLLLGSFSAYFNLKRIKSSCEVISIRIYSIVFIDENGDKANGCFANRRDSIFIILKKSDKKIKDIKFREIYIYSNNKNDFDFSTGYKKYYTREQTPETVDEYNFSRIVIKVKREGRAANLRLYKCLDGNPDEKLIKFISSLIIDGKPTSKTLNFYTEYNHILLDLKNS